MREGRVDATLELPGCACCLCLLDCRQGDALLGMQDDSGGKDIAYALDSGEVQVARAAAAASAALHVTAAAQCVMVEGCSTIPLWTLPPRPGAAVTSMCFSAAASSAPNLVLARSNGSFEVAARRRARAATADLTVLRSLLQVYDCSEAGAPRRIFCKELGQSLCCLQVGRMCPSPPPLPSPSTSVAGA